MAETLDLYAAYLAERGGAELVADPEGRGFATFAPTSEGMRVVDIFVRPEHRKSGVAAALADRIATIAKERAFTALIGTVDPRTNGATTSLRAQLAYGFEVVEVRGPLIVLKKEI